MKLEKQVQDLIRQLQPQPPVNIVGIAKLLGLNVWEDHTLPETVSGKVFLDSYNGGPVGYSIVVRKQDSFVRKRFTVAHEIAHYLLHRKLFSKELQDDALYRSKLSTPVEAEANGLAAELLMPWHLLMPLSNRANDKLAQIFQVSERAMEIRMRSGIPYTRD